MSALIWFLAGSMATHVLWVVFVVPRLAAADREDQRRIAKAVTKFMETRQ